MEQNAWNSESVPRRGETIRLVTDDARLARLIGYVAEDLSRPFEAVEKSADSDLEGFWLLDLDLQTAQRIAAEGTIPPERVAGICHDEKMIPEESRRGIGTVLCRPISLRELRRILTEAPDRSGHSGTEESFGGRPDISLDGTMLHFENQRIRLTRHETAIMALLLEKRGQTVSRGELDACIGALREDSGSNKTEVYLCLLRRKLEEPTGRKLIRTVRGVGYRLD